mmetsp:Transcript_71698/g.145035  ORF Transcript_71698/g.145035 Transcript_71698/m.145035 type:complete len:96 (-) Transcript_71698:7-294(-)
MGDGEQRQRDVEVSGSDKEAKEAEGTTLVRTRSTYAASFASRNRNNRSFHVSYQKASEATAKQWRGLRESDDWDPVMVRLFSRWYLGCLREPFRS